MELCDIIKNLRRKSNMTQEQLARRAGLTRQYVGLVEKHQKTPSVKVLVALCDALDLDVYIDPK